ncbi:MULTISPECIES: hypothetical protein [Paenibacillus]|uniref:hypothetical protein n=1 Tax=Paenibacillus TaxID=44249 RepID=UPI000418DA28|nr:MULTISPECIES: hypothetical protein [Paenibacillus]KGP78112.1 hypothetical protein P364_0130115 [Paenibacillus sp. MAEPY2]KGP89366.1 hypothetical protein P363_0101535 [Paenibacillus sp. MAEPY1]OZQ71083.1 hypothetical protein CA599_11150 [Paenibacillus taichungensis]
MKLKAIEMTGFKNYAEYASISFGRINHIVGDRDRGKTALCEAIVWSVLGCDLQGHTKGIKKYVQSWNTKYTRVLTVWEIAGYDQPVSICREIKGKTVHLSIDEVEATQKDIDAIVGQTDTFLCIFVPGYFDSLTQVRKRNVLLSLMPKIEYSAAIACLSIEDQERLKTMTDPVDLLNELNDEMNEWNEYIGDIETRIQKIRIASNFNGDADTNSEIIRELEEKTAELNELSAVQGPPIPDYVTEWESDLILLGKRYRETHDEWRAIYYDWKPEDTEGKKKRALLIQVKKTECQALLDEGVQIKENISRMYTQHEKETEDFKQQKEQEMQFLQSDIQRLQVKQTMLAKTSVDSEKLPHLQQKLLEGQKEQREISLHIQAVQHFLMQYAQLQVSKANLQMTSSEILLERRTVKGVIRLQHKLLYQGKEFGFTSSEQAQVSLDLSRLEEEVNGRSVPVFIEHGEPVQNFGEEQGQIFVTSVIPQAELSYEIIVA